MKSSGPPRNPSALGYQGTRKSACTTGQICQESIPIRMPTGVNFVLWWHQFALEFLCVPVCEIRCCHIIKRRYRTMRKPAQKCPKKQQTGQISDAESYENSFLWNPAVYTHPAAASKVSQFHLYATQQQLVLNQAPRVPSSFLWNPAVYTHRAAASKVSRFHPLSGFTGHLNSSAMHSLAVVEGRRPEGPVEECVRLSAKYSL